MIQACGLIHLEVDGAKSTKSVSRTETRIPLLRYNFKRAQGRSGASLENKKLTTNLGSKSNTFIDLFSGIGGFHLACKQATEEFKNPKKKAKCVFACEIDKNARTTYINHFRKIEPKLFANNQFATDITQVDPNEIEDFRLLCAGFPCQPFSQAGKKLGFEDIRGTMFSHIGEIIRVKKPESIFLENVNFIKNHDNGETFKEIRRVLEKKLRYRMHYFDVRASDHGLPQHRPRVFMIGFLDHNIDFSPPKKKPLKLTMSEILGGEVDRDIGFTLRVGGKNSPISDRRNWDGYVVDGFERRLTVPEAKRMQGFPKGFKFPVSDAVAMRQLGNSVAVKAVRDYAEQIFLALK